MLRTRRSMSALFALEPCCHVAALASVHVRIQHISRLWRGMIRLMAVSEIGMSPRQQVPRAERLREHSREKQM